MSALVFFVALFSIIDQTLLALYRLSYTPFDATGFEPATSLLEGELEVSIGSNNIL